jgi:hypothetical protein
MVTAIHCRNRLPPKQCTYNFDVTPIEFASRDEFRNRNQLAA